MTPARFDELGLKDLRNVLRIDCELGRTHRMATKFVLIHALCRRDVDAKGILN